ncbi:MAG TPA: T9SS type A sorting domain-containing protein [Saprospiraceae bacterium]|nr:T9SS type A sorting domain-containing protein [Saprospiraceae bacterium]
MFVASLFLIHYFMKTIFCLFCIFHFTLLFAQPGTLYPNFGSNGITITQIGAHVTTVRNGMALQPDGKVVMVGWTGYSPSFDLAVARYLVNGKLDSSFTNGGVIYANSGGLYNDYASSTAIQADGKILVAGYSTLGPHGDFIIYRFKSNGLPDSTFNGKGNLKLSINNDDQCYAMALQSDGKILLAGYSSIQGAGNFSNFALVRIHPNGTLDSTFGMGGKAILPFGNVHSKIYAIALQSDGKIVAVGSINLAGAQDLALARFNADGTADISFGDQGKIIDPLSDIENAAYAVAIQPDGKILVAGSGHAFSNYGNFALLRYCPGGYRDESFGTNGLADVPPFGVGNTAYSMVLQPDSRIVVAGTAGGDLALAKYNPDGTLHTGFGNNGLVISNISTVSPGNSTVYSLLLQPDNSLLAGGYVQILNNGNAFHHFILAKYFNSLDTGLVNSVACAPVETHEPSLEKPGIQVSPNPTEQQTTITYDLQQDDYIVIRLFDLSGRLVKNVVNAEFREQGDHKETITLDVVPPGYYILQIANSNHTNSVKIVKQ